MILDEHDLAILRRRRPEAARHLLAASLAIDEADDANAATILRNAADALKKEGSA